MKRFGVAFASIFLISVLAVSFSIAFPGKRQVAFRSFINLFHLDASRASFRAELPKEGFETRILAFKLDLKECFVYPAAAGYDYLRIADLKPATKPGEPQLPMKTFVVELEKSDQVYGVEVVDGLVREIDGELNILPTSQPVAWEPGARQGGHIPDERVYGMDRPFPGRLVSYETGKDSKRQYVFVRLFPVQYTPSKKKAVVLTEATIKLYYGTSSAESEFTGQGLEPPTDAQCVIICPSSSEIEGIESAAWTLSNFHNSNGIASTVVTTDAIISAYEPAGDPPFSGYKDKKLRGRRNIKNYNYELAREIVSYLEDSTAHPNLEYVTILGDALLVPPSYYYSEKGGWYSDWIPTDLFYASPNHDLVPDFKVGRLSVSDYSEASNVVNKIISWSQAVSWDWFQNVYLVAGRGHDTPEYHGERGTIMPANWDYFSSMTVHKCFHTDGNEHKGCMVPAISKVDNNDEIDVGMLFQMDHGSGHSITLEDGDDLDASELLGYQTHTKVPVFISISCNNGAFDLAIMERPYPYTFGEAVLRSPAAGIAYFGGSRTNQGAGDFSIYDEGNIPWELVKESYNVELLHYVIKSYHEGADTLGQMASGAVNKFLEANIMEGVNLESLFRFVLLGDPALQIPPQDQYGEHGIAICNALDPLGYDESDIPIYGIPSVTITATADSPSVIWKLLEANVDSVLGNHILGYPPCSYITPGDLTQGLYLVRTATESAVSSIHYVKENWLYFKIEGGIEGKVHVSSIEMGLDTKGPFTNATATVTIVTVVDGQDVPISGATVHGYWEDATADSDSGATGPNGQVTLSSAKVKNAASETNFVFYVDMVDHSSYIYEPGSNVETFDNITVP
jgi:hypothetical protein